MKKSNTHSLDSINYSTRIPKILFAIFLGCFFILAFLNYYPIGDKIKFFVKNTVLKNSTCPIDFGEFNIELLFIPKIVISNIVVPASCFSKEGESLKIDYTKLYFMGPSFSPLGLAFKAETLVEGQPLDVRISLGMNEQVINFQEDAILLQRFKNLPFLPIKMQGQASVNIRAALNNNQITNLKIYIESKDFVLPSQTIQDVKLSNLPLKVFNLKAETREKGKLIVEKFIMGEPQSPLRLQFKGAVLLNPNSFSDSELNLKGEINFSESFLESYSLIKFMFNAYSQKDGFYQVNIGGTLSQPSPSPL